MPALMESSDFLTSFYLAGRLFCEGKWQDLYPGPETLSLLNSPFNSYAHQVLHNLPGSILAAICIHRPPLLFLLARYLFTS